jgi:ComF family protein
MVYNWLDIIQQYLLPPTCLLCNQPGNNSLDLCKGCFESFIKNQHCCYRCGEILTQQVPTPSLCGHCLKQQPVFEKTHAPFIYQSSIRYLIQQLKFNAQYKNARLLGALLAHQVIQTAEMPELIIPVPLHSARYRQRGFNQALEIARTVAKITTLPLNTCSCIRIRNTLQQIDLPAKQRRLNMKKAFAIKTPISAHHIAIVDDVMTTGTTVNELAKALNQSGVSRIDIWVCARA